MNLLGGYILLIIASFISVIYWGYQYGKCGGIEHAVKSKRGIIISIIFLFSTVVIFFSILFWK